MLHAAIARLLGIRHVPLPCRLLSTYRYSVHEVDGAVCMAIILQGSVWGNLLLEATALLLGFTDKRVKSIVHVESVAQTRGQVQDELRRQTRGTRRRR